MGKNHLDTLLEKLAMPISQLSIKQTIVLTAALLAATGCLKRRETIQVQPDGWSRIVVELDGDPQDVMEGDASFADPGPWSVDDEFRTNNDGEQQLCRTAILDIAPGAPFPTHYAGNDEELSKASLTMTTELTLEQRPDGTYYHFKRVYHRRAWAEVGYFRTKLMEEHATRFGDKDFEDMDRDERLEVARTLINVESTKTVALSQKAARAIQPRLNQLEWLAVRQGISQAFENIDPARMVELLGSPDSGAEIQAQVRLISEEIERRIAGILDNEDATGGRTQAFLQQLEFQRLAFLISEDLNDEDLEFTLKLPGTIVGHNSLNEAPEGGSISWAFGGGALHDRDHVLMASSFVPHD